MVIISKYLKKRMAAYFYLPLPDHIDYRSVRRTQAKDSIDLFHCGKT